jgi:DnaJ-class molecular chaperone
MSTVICIAPCATCDGQGTVHQPQFIGCPICDGHGIFAGGRCVGCGGLGGETPSLETICPACDGSGVSCSVRQQTTLVSASALSDSDTPLTYFPGCA